MAIRPSGIVTFMFTDVEGSTQLWDAHPEAMKGALARHDELLRAAIDAHGGYVFSTAGDAFAAAFNTASDAVAACLDAQLALIGEPWDGPEIRVRMGVHTGSADERDGDYFGPTLNRAARIMSAGHGMQVLVSRTAADLLSGSHDLVDLGTHTLKDLREPQHLFVLAHEALPVVDRPLRTADIRQSNLPAYLTTFVGREETAAALEALVRANRLTVLTGVGGTGKTRLAVETGARLIGDHADGVWMAELAPITDPDNIIPSIADVWGLRAGEGASISEVLTRYLWGKDLVLIVDNCEHLLGPAADAVRGLLDACPNLRIVATSRESLGIPGEAILQVPSLGLPRSGADVESTEAGALFLDRARSVRADFAPSPADLDAIARIVRRIDGIPLGLELAAARLRSLSPGDLADRLEDSFRILSGSSKTALPRQRTLQATIDWSHDLLDEPARALFRRLSVFVGGFDLAAAEAVCVGDPIEEWEVLDLLDALVDQSLVVVVPGSDTRYRLLEPIRQYAQERLGPSGEASSLRGRHAEHYAAFAAETAPLLRGREQVEWWDRVAIEYDNFRAALETFLAHGRIEEYLSVGFDLFTIWVRDGLQVEGIATMLAGLEKADDAVDVETRVRGWAVTAIMGAEITSIDGIDHGRRGLALAEGTGDPRLIGMAEISLGAAINHSTTDPEYLEHLLRGRELLDEHPPGWWDPTWERALVNLLLGAYLPDDDPRKEEHFEVATRLTAEVGDDMLYGASLVDSVGLYRTKGLEWAERNVREAVGVLQSIKAPNWLAHAQQTLGYLMAIQGEDALAADAFASSIPLMAQCGDINCWANSARGLASAELTLGRPEHAAQLLGEVIDAFPVLPLQDIALPRTLDAAARTLVALGRHDAAAVVLGRALEVPFPEATIRPREPIHDEIRTALRDVLDQGTLSAALAEGAGLTDDEALARARAALTG